MHCNARSWSCLREVLWVMICEGQCKKPHSSQGQRVLTSPSNGCWLAQDRFTLLLKCSWVQPRWISTQASWRSQLQITIGSALILRNCGLYFSTVFFNSMSQLYFSPVFINCIFWLKFGWSQFDGAVSPESEEVYNYKSKERSHQRINCELWQRIIWTALCLFPFPLSFSISTACSEPSSTWASLPGKDHRPWTMGCVNRHCGPNLS